MTSQMRHDRDPRALIGSDRVEGTAVYRPDGTLIGTIDRVMIGKDTGIVAYAVLSLGGFLGFGADHAPLPWSLLHYDKARDGFIVDLDETELRSLLCRLDGAGAPVKPAQPAKAATPPKKPVYHADPSML